MSHDSFTHPLPPPHTHPLTIFQVTDNLMENRVFAPEKKMLHFPSYFHCTSIFLASFVTDFFHIRWIFLCWTFNMNNENINVKVKIVKSSQHYWKSQSSLIGIFEATILLRRKGFPNCSHYTWWYDPSVPLSEKSMHKPGKPSVGKVSVKSETIGHF